MEVGDQGIGTVISRSPATPHGEIDVQQGCQLYAAVLFAAEHESANEQVPGQLRREHRSRAVPWQRRPNVCLVAITATQVATVGEQERQARPGCLPV